MVTLLDHTPAVYSSPLVDDSFQRVVSVFEPGFAKMQEEIRDMPAHVALPATTRLLKDWLTGLGNPFSIDHLPERQQRLLALNLVHFYTTRGTLEGLRQAITLLFSTTPIFVLDYQQAWKVGFSTLGIETTIWDGTTSYITVKLPAAVVAAPNQLHLLTTVVEFFKPIHMSWFFEPS